MKMLERVCAICNVMCILHISVILSVWNLKTRGINYHSHTRLGIICYNIEQQNEQHNVAQHIRRAKFVSTINRECTYHIWCRLVIIIVVFFNFLV